MNELVKLHRARNPTDPRTDEQLTLQYGEKYPQYFETYPDLKAEYDTLKGDERRAFAPSLIGEAKGGLARATESLKQTAIGATAFAADAVGADDFRDKLLKSIMERRANSTLEEPTVKGIEDIRGPSDFIRWLAAGIGEVAPSLAEGILASTAGAVIGSSVPVVGTIGGGISGLVARQAVKSLIKKKVAGSIAELLAKEGAEALIKKEAGQILKLTGSALAGGLNSYVQQAGEIYSNAANEPGADIDKALNAAFYGAFLGTVPETFVPSYIVNKFIRASGAKVTRDAKHKFYGYLTRLAQESSKTIPAEALTEAFQQYVGIGAERYAKGIPVTDPLSKEEISEIVNAGALGSIGGGLAGPIAAIPGGAPPPTPAVVSTADQTQPPPPNPGQLPLPNTPNQPVGPGSSGASGLAPGMQNYTGLNPNSPEGQAEIRQFREYAERELAGDTTVALSIAQFNQQRKNAYLLVKDKLAKEKAEAVAKEKADKPDLETPFVEALNKGVADTVATQKAAEAAEGVGTTPAGQTPASTDPGAIVGGVEGTAETEGTEVTTQVPGATTATPIAEPATPVTPVVAEPVTPAPPAVRWKASTPLAGVAVEGDYDVVDAAELTTSFDKDYDQALQPRDRSRAASQNQIATISSKLEPQRLGHSETTDLGAPVVDERNHVLSGNGRVSALRAVYHGESGGTDYQSWLLENAGRFGIDPAKVSAAKNPVLVRRVTDYGGLSKEEFARQSNQQQVLGMGEAEQAGSDARMLIENPALFDLFLPSEDGDVLAASNRPFLNAFIQGTGDQASLLTKDGYNGQALAKRVKNAILGAVLGPENRQLLSDLLERSDELGVRTIVSGLLAAAPKLSQLKGSTYDLSAYLEHALGDLVRLKSTGEGVDHFLDHEDFFGSHGRSAQTDHLLRFLSHVKSIKELAEALLGYHGASLHAIEDTRSGGLFGDTVPSRNALIEKIGQKVAPTSTQTDLPTGKSSTGDRKPVDAQPKTPAKVPPGAAPAPAQVGPATPDAGITDLLDIERGAIKAETRQRSGKAYPRQAGYFDVTDPGSKKLTAILLSQSTTKSSGNKKSLTHRITFFEDQETTEIIGVPTYGVYVNGKKVARVGPLSTDPVNPKTGEKPSVTLAARMKSGRYVPVGSALSKVQLFGLEHYPALTFPDYQAFEAAVATPARAKIASDARAYDDFNKKLDEDESGGTKTGLGGGETVLKTEQSTDSAHPTVALLESIDELLPRRSGKIARNLTPEQVGWIVLRVLDNPANETLSTHASDLALQEIQDDEKATKIYEALSPTEKRAYQYRYLVQIVHAFYAEGRFEGSYRLAEDPIVTRDSGAFAASDPGPLAWSPGQAPSPTSGPAGTEPGPATGASPAQETDSTGEVGIEQDGTTVKYRTEEEDKASEQRKELRKEKRKTYFATESIQESQKRKRAWGEERVRPNGDLFFRRNYTGPNFKSATADILVDEKNQVITVKISRWDGGSSVKSYSTKRDSQHRVEYTLDEVQDIAKAEMEEMVDGPASGPDSTTKLREGEQEGPTSARERTKAYQAILSKSAVSGLNISVLQQALGRLVSYYERRSTKGGVAVQIVLAVRDVLNPTYEDFVTLLHEIGHHVYATLSPEDQAILQRAIKRATDKKLGLAGFTPTFDVGKETDAILQEERLVEFIAQKIAAEGFNPAEAAGLAQALVRALKDLLMQAAMVVMEALGFQPNPDLALAYLQNRLESFLAGDSSSMSVLSWLGGPNLRTDQVVALGSRAPGSSPIPAVWNPETGMMDYRQTLPDDLDIIRFKSGNDIHAVSPNLPSEQKATEVASNNQVQTLLEKLFSVFDQFHNTASSGQKLLDQQQFINWVLDGKSAPTEIIAEFNKQLVEAGLAPLDPLLSMNSLGPDAQRAVANMALAMERNLQVQMKERADQAVFNVSNAPGSVQTKFDTAATRLVRLVRDYSNADFILSIARDTGKIFLDQLKKDVKDVRAAAWKRGAIAQNILALEGKEDGEVPRQYENVINRIYKQLNEEPGGGPSFMAMLEAAAQLTTYNGTPVTWAYATIRQTKEFIRNSKEVIFDPLREDSVEANALLSVLASFAQENEIVMEMLALKKHEAHEERGIANDILVDAMGNHRDSLKQASQRLGELKRLGIRVGRILDQMEKAKKAQEKLLRQLKDDNDFMAFHADAELVFRKHMTEKEAILGVRWSNFEGNDGETIIVAPQANSLPKDVESSEAIFRVERDGSANDQLIQYMQQNEAWMEHNGPGTTLYQGSTWNKLRQQNDTILANLMDSDHQEKKRSTVTRFFDSMVNRLRLVGHPAALAAARQLQNYVSWTHRWKANVETVAHHFNTSERLAMKALGVKPGLKEHFRRVYYNYGLSFINQNSVLLNQMSGPDAEREALRLLRSSFLANATTRDAVSRPGAWEALEKFYRTAAASSQAFVKQGKEMDVKVTDDAGMLRDVKGAPLFEMMRTLNEQLELTYKGTPGDPKSGMREPWLAFGEETDPTTGKKVNNPAGMAAAYTADPAAFAAKVSKLFPPNVWRDFARPIAHRQGRSSFYAPSKDGEHYQFADITDVTQAFNAAKGNVVAFAEHLYDATPPSPSGQTKAEFVAETISTYQSLFGIVHSIYQKREKDGLKTIATLQRMLMDDRKSDELPAEFLKYRTYDVRNSREISIHLTYHAAFGTGAEAFQRNLLTATNAMEQRQALYQRDIHDYVETANPGLNPIKLLALKKERAKALNIDYEQVLKVAADISTLHGEKRHFEAFIGSFSGLPLESKAWLEALSAMVASTVQGPGTALVDISSLAKPLTQQGWSTQGLAQVRQTVKSFLAEGIGSFGSLFFKGMKMNADNALLRQELGYQESANEATLREKIYAIMHEFVPQPNEGLGIGRRVLIGARAVRAFVGHGFRGRGKNSLYFRFNPLAIFSMVTKLMHAAAIDGVFRVYGDMIMRASEFYRLHPGRMGTLGNPQPKITAAEMGYESRYAGLLNDAKAFDYMKVALNRYGTSLEIVAADFVKRRNADPKAPVMTKETMRRLATIAQTEILQEGSVATRPSGTITNPILAATVPLLGWSMAQFTSVGRTIRGPNGESMDWKARMKFQDKDFNRGIGMMVSMIPIGLVFALMREQYDERILGKKANVREFGGSPGNNMLAAMEKLGRVGTFGIVMDPVNAFLNVDSNREFSVDSRVFAVSAVKNAFSAFTTLFKQGEGTYATVYRPLLQSLGGSGYLQYADALIEMTGVDVSETRIIARQAVLNTLKVAGRTVGLDVRTGRGGISIPTPAKPWLREMEMATYANDPEGFKEAYDNAVAAHRKMIDGSTGKPKTKEEAEKDVRSTFMSYHPLKLSFISKASEGQYKKALSAMSERGQLAVREAIRLFDHYGDRLNIKPFFEEDKPSARASAAARFNPDRFFNRAINRERAGSLF